MHANLLKCLNVMQLYGKNYYVDLFSFNCWLPCFLIIMQDLNLGCPQDRAYQDHYGSFLLDKTDWPLVSSIVESMAAATTLPIFCKIRLLPKLEDTIRFCQLLEKSGASLIAVHGRMRKSTKKRRDGPADLDAIREIVKHIHVPIVSNGNISTPQDVDANLQHTDAAGIMSAEAVLCNPSIFAGEDSHRCPRKTHDNLFRYLDLAEKYPPPSFKYVQDHVSNLLGRSGRGRQIQYTYRGPYKPIALKKKIFEMSTSIEDLRSLVAEVFPE